LKIELKGKSIKICVIVTACMILLAVSLFGQRLMENLGRGTVAVRSSSGQVFVSWRILGLEFNAGVTYSLYRGNTRIASNLFVSNYVDNTSSNSTYSVAAVIGGSEQTRSPAVNVITYIHGSNSLPCLRVPIRAASGYTPFLIYVGDLDGNGEYDFVFDLHPDDASGSILLQAVKQDGTYLWQLDCGSNSVNKDNIEPGSSALGIGHGDNFTVRDINNDGKAEVIVRTAAGVRFGDGAALSESDNNRQFISVLEGTTGREIARTAVPTDFIGDGPMNGHMGIAYLDGINPSVVWSSKNRMDSGEFNMMVSAWSWNNGSLVQNWKFLRPAIGGGNYPDGHNIRCGDFDGDGRDEVCPFGYVLDDNGSILYSLGDRGVVHGDRFHIGDMDPYHAGLEGYGIQQNNPSGLAWYYYDARSGAILQSQYGDAGVDYARGFAGDLDPRYPGYEFHTFTDGLYNVNGTRITTSLPDSYPNLRIWWDGDVLSENLDNNKMTKWDYIADINDSEIRLYTFTNTIQAGRNTPGFYGDICGDWREEVVYTADDKSGLLVFTTVTPTSTRLYTLAHEPLYRNCFNTKGYYQSNMIGYYLGDGMSSPPTPDIKYVDGGGTGTCDPTPIDPYIQVNDGTWINASSVTVDFGDKVDLGPHPTSGGTWRWSGCGVSGSSREITLYPANSCTVTAVYTNDCGAESSLDFNITVAGTPDVLNGDVNNSGTIDIVDALLVAQYYVGLNPQGFDPGRADTNCNGSVDIVDALLIAQHYVGLIDQFC
jgi:rhamnogalacturonan endolyase